MKCMNINLKINKQAQRNFHVQPKSLLIYALFCFFNQVPKQLHQNLNMEFCYTFVPTTPLNRFSS